jgi:hypothetical protein
MSVSTFTPLSHLTLPSRAALQDEFVGRKLTTLRTPALVVDRAGFKENCRYVADEVGKRGMTFRAHVKSEYSSGRFALVVLLLLPALLPRSFAR